MTLAPASPPGDWGDTPAEKGDSLIERLAGEMTRRWRLGERPLAEEFLDNNPNLWDQPHAAVELIYEEICLRQELEGAVHSEEFLVRFPLWRTQLRTLLDCHRALEPGVPGPRFPGPGDWVADSCLKAELGRGAQARVFVATQPALADRPVVLKLVPLGNQEHLSLARLQHTHIVPVYTVWDDPARRLRALCQPYFGGAPLDRVLAALQPDPPNKRKGQQIVTVLTQMQAAAAVPLPVQGPACRFLEKATYTRAVCWMGRRLAEALHYAHERGLVHLDLKPSNVLLAADGEPMLLDFHLAQAPLAAGGPPPLWLGGTPGYMAPEQQAALQAVRAGQPLAAAVDARADLYSLGVLLYEALGGRLTGGHVPARPAAELRRYNPRVSVGLADVIARCLADRPSQRYPDAGALAEDLRRHLEHKPLRGVPNRSWGERWRKWRRGQPLTLPMLIVLVVLGLGGFLLAVVSQQARDENARNGQAIRIRAIDDLHRFTERVRTLGGAEDWPRDQVPLIETHCRNFWEQRRRILDQLNVDASREEQRQVQTDLLDLAILWTGLQVRLAGKDDQPARLEALRVLAQAEELFGSSRALWLERLAHARKMGLKELAAKAEQQAEKLEPRNAWEHFALGRALFHAGKVEEAAKELDKSIDLQPRSLWAHFYRGRCHSELGNHAAALEAFNICVVLAPTQPWCYCNRALTQDNLRKAALQAQDRAAAKRFLDDARKSLARALQINPNHKESLALLKSLDGQL